MIQGMSYQMKYSIEKEKDYYNLRVEEYKNGVHERTKVISQLTDNLEKAQAVKNLLEQNHVFAIHVEEILEELGFYLEKKEETASE